MSDLRKRLEALKTDTRDWLKNWAENGLPEYNEWAFRLVGCCPNGCPTTPQKERRGVTEKETLVSIVFNDTCSEVEERWQICCVLCGYQGPKAPTKQLAVIEHLAKENNLLRAILAGLPSEGLSTLDELQIEKHMEEAKNVLAELCKTGGRSWRMCIPVEETDTDRVLYRLLADLQKVIDGKASQPPTLRDAISKLKDLPEDDAVRGFGTYEQGLLCGLEDAGYQTDGYAAMRYGYECALERYNEWLCGEIESIRDREWTTVEGE